MVAVAWVLGLICGVGCGVFSLMVVGLVWVMVLVGVQWWVWCLVWCCGREGFVRVLGFLKYEVCCCWVLGLICGVGCWVVPDGGMVVAGYGFWWLCDGGPGVQCGAEKERVLFRF